MKTSLQNLGAGLLLPLAALSALLPAEAHGNVLFALLWLVGLLLLALPAALLEAALVRRSQQWPLAGMAVLTREADAKTFWRKLSGLALLLTLSLLACSLIRLDSLSPESVPVPLLVPGAVLLLALLLVWVGFERVLLPAGVVALFAVVAVGVSSGVSLQASWPGTQGMAQALLLALLASGAGLGIYAWLAQRTLDATRALPAILPFWAGQAVAGTAVILLGVPAQPGAFAACAQVVPVLAAAALLLQLATAQGQARGWARLPALLISAGVVAVWLVLYAFSPLLDRVLPVLWWLVLVGQCVFVGWVMKISHVRKALNFESEAAYNLWRVAVRLLLPLLSLWALVMWAS